MLTYIKTPGIFLKKIKMKLFKQNIPSLDIYFKNTLCSFKIEKNKTSQINSSWDKLLNDIIDEINNASMSFLRCPTISRTLHPNQQELAYKIFSDIVKDSFYNLRILPLLHDHPFGNPYLCDFFPLASPVSIQHSYYIFLINKFLGIFVPSGNISHITEIGGGYGNLCRLLYNMGYNDNYTIVDFKEMHQIQRHYLKHVIPNQKFINSIKYCTIEDKKYKIIKQKSILFATFSINEMPIETRKKIESALPAYDYIFIAFNSNFDGIDNINYFTNLCKELNKTFEIKKMKDKYRNAWYLLCKSKKINN